MNAIQGTKPSGQQWNRLLNAVFTIHLFPQERISLVKPKRGEKEEPLRRISGNLQSQGRSKLAPKVGNSKAPTGEFRANEV